MLPLLECGAVFEMEGEAGISLQARLVGKSVKICLVSVFMTDALSSFRSLHCREEAVRPSFSLIGHWRKGPDQQVKCLVISMEMGCWQNDPPEFDNPSASKENYYISAWMSDLRFDCYGNGL